MAVKFGKCWRPKRIKGRRSFYDAVNEKIAAKKCPKCGGAVEQAGDDFLTSTITLACKNDKCDAPRFKMKYPLWPEAVKEQPKTKKKVTKKKAG